MSDFEMWVVYDHPRDRPGHFVARKWIIRPGIAKPTEFYVAATTLKDVRALIPPGLYCLARAPEDEPQIVETWL
jgi:hypothetical protein